VSDVGSYLGYESTRFGDTLGTDEKMLEKSLRSGCKTVVIRSSPNHTSKYELISDLAVRIAKFSMLLNQLQQFILQTFTSFFFFFF
jgi:hypothetical protein